MIRIRRNPSRKIKLVIITKNSVTAKALLDNTDMVVCSVRHQTHGPLIETLCHGERRQGVRRVIKSTFVPKDMWVYEYHDREGFVYHDKLYRKLPLLSLETLMDVVYETGLLSTREAMAVLLRKRIFRLDDDKISPLLEMEDAPLYQSILDALLNSYTQEDMLKYLETDVINRMERTADHLLKNIRKHHARLKAMQHLTYEEFLENV